MKKYFVIIMAVTCALLAAGVVFNAIEMQEYDLFNIIIERMTK